MPTNKGNKFWLKRSKHGRSKIFTSGKMLWTSACEYFTWVENNPLKESKPFSYQGVIKITEVNKMRAMTLDGLFLFLDIGSSTWHDYKTRGDYPEVMERIENVIRSQKFAGAAADLLNANIIARDLGLRDNQDVTSDGKAIKNEWHIHPVTTYKKD